MLRIQLLVLACVFVHVVSAQTLQQVTDNGHTTNRTLFVTGNNRLGNPAGATLGLEYSSENAQGILFAYDYASQSYKPLTTAGSRLLVNNVVDDGATPLQIQDGLRIAGMSSGLMLGEPFVADGTIKRWVMQRRSDNIFGGGTGAVTFWADKSGGYYAPLVFANNGNVLLASNSNAISGNVGIGNVNPSDKLTVNGNVFIKPDYTSAWKEGIAFDMSETRRWGGLRWFRGRSNYDGNWYIGYTGLDDTDDLVFGAGNGNEQVNNILRMTKAGNVGIGTLTPTDKLSVNGTIRTKKVVVTQAGWADYVFDSSYQLPTLDAVESFIQTNKRLPDMPSTAEVANKGLDVGETQKLLLQKIEEMTLYMIDLKKQNTLLLEKNEQLEKRVQKIESKNNL